MDAVIAGYRLPSESSFDQPRCFVNQLTPPIVWLVDDQGLGLRLLAYRRGVWGVQVGCDPGAAGDGADRAPHSGVFEDGGSFQR